MLVKSDDAEIFYEVLGSGPALVLLHAFPTNHHMWRPVAELLSVRYRCILPDLRGQGDSGAGTGPATMEKHVEDIRRVCQDVGVGRAVFAGVSIGGYILFEAWRRMRERIAGIVLCDTKAQADTAEGRANRLRMAEDVRRQGTETVIEGMLPKLIGETTRHSRPDITESVRKMAVRTPVEGIALTQQGMAERPDSIETIKTISVPSLLIFGDEDVLSTAADAELMQRHIQNAKLEMVPRAGHLAVFEQPEHVARTMRNFLDALPRWE